MLESSPAHLLRIHTVPGVDHDVSGHRGRDATPIQSPVFLPVGEQQYRLRALRGVVGPLGEGDPVRARVDRWVSCGDVGAAASQGLRDGNGG